METYHALARSPDPPPAGPADALATRQFRA